jgi:hypothetical protein
MQIDIQSTALPTSQWFRRNLKWIGILAFLFLAGLVLRRLGVGFSFLSADEKQALEMVEVFHERMNAGHFDKVYDDAHPAFRHAESRQEWLRHMKETREPCGLYRTRRSSTLDVIMGPPVQVHVDNGSTFEGCDLHEQFRFARDGGKLQLLAYGVMSYEYSRHYAHGFLVGCFERFPCSP